MLDREFGSSSDDWIEDSQRMERIEEAAKDGCDGSTHQEHIQDWRKGFRDWMRYDRKGYRQSCELFEAGVEKYWDDLELWHQANGTLFQQIG